MSRWRARIQGEQPIPRTVRLGRIAPGRIVRSAATGVAVAALPVLALAAPAASAQTTATAHASALAAPRAVPGPPSGWTTQFSDDFSGSSGAGAGSQWKYDTGPGSSFGTGEIETMTNSASNVHYDGSGHLRAPPRPRGTHPASGWTSGRVETQAATFGAAAGGVVRIESVLQQPNV